MTVSVLDAAVQVTEPTIEQVLVGAAATEVVQVEVVQVAQVVQASEPSLVTVDAGLVETILVEVITGLTSRAGPVGPPGGLSTADKARLSQVLRWSGTTWQPAPDYDFGHRTWISSGVDPTTTSVTVPDNDTWINVAT